MTYTRKNNQVCKMEKLIKNRKLKVYQIGYSIGEMLENDECFVNTKRGTATRLILLNSVHCVTLRGFCILTVKVR